ncbi:MAG: TIGR03067 domain-containing protein [Pirellulales bacterium]
MPRHLRWLLILVIGFASIPTRAADDDKSPLQGVWVGQSLITDGTPAPEADAQRMRFTFQKETLLLRGNFKDDNEAECTYTIDPKQSPKQLDFTPPKEKAPILCIYEISGDTLKLCIRHANNNGPRPKEFVSTKDSPAVLVVLKRQTP